MPQLRGMEFVCRRDIDAPAARGTSMRTQMAAGSVMAPVLLKEVDVYQDKRYLTAIGEFDRVMGGGIVPGSVTLIGGDPGIGKSTIVLQAGCALARAGLKVLYISGEESVKQAKMRADRVAQTANENFFIVNEIDVQTIVGYIHELAPQVVIIDSIQVVHLAEISSAPGFCGPGQGKCRGLDTAG